MGAQLTLPRTRDRERGQQSRVFIPRAPFLKKTKTSKCIRNNKKGHSSVSLGRPLLGSLIYRLGPCGPHPLLPLEPPVWRWWCYCSVPIRLFIGHHLTSSAGLGIKTFTHAKNENQRCNSSGDVLVWVVGRVLCHHATGCQCLNPLLCSLPVAGLVIAIN